MDGEMVGADSFCPVFGIMHPEWNVQNPNSDKIVSGGGSRSMLRVWRWSTKNEIIVFWKTKGKSGQEFPTGDNKFVMETRERMFPFFWFPSLVEDGEDEIMQCGFLALVMLKMKSCSVDSFFVHLTHMISCYGCCCLPNLTLRQFYCFSFQFKLLYLWFDLVIPAEAKYMQWNLVPTHWPNNPFS